VIHILTANIGQFGLCRVSDEFVINVQNDSSDDESSSDSSSSVVSDSELTRNSCKVILIISTITALFMFSRCTESSPATRHGGVSGRGGIAPTHSRPRH
jgi:hypothetical protein